MPDVVELIEKDHREVEGLFATFEASEEDQGQLDHLRSVTCPNCQQEFELPA